MTQADRPIDDQARRVLGPRAHTTRRRMLAAAAELLQRKSLRELRVSDIARQVGSSPATFYQYFKDAEDAVLLLAELATAEMPAIVETIGGDWNGEAGLQQARAIADAFIRHWDQHRAVLRARNIASDEGDVRFQEVRNRAMRPVLLALSAKVAEHRPGADAAGESPLAAAAALAAILERLAAYHAELESVGVTRTQLVETTARIVSRTVTGSG
jgi:AcrR family transcriptional regulator